MDASRANVLKTEARTVLGEFYSQKETKNMQVEKKQTFR